MRMLLALLLAALLLPAVATRAAQFDAEIGLQLYSLRGIATQNPPKALKEAADFRPRNFFSVN